MQFLKKILGKGEPAAAAPVPETPAAATPAAEAVPGVSPAVSPAPAALPPDPEKAPSENGDRIRVFDAFGREVFVPREEWCGKILPGAIRKEWDHPDGLAALILQSLGDGLASEVMDAAVQLEDIDANLERGNVILGLVHFELGHAEAAEKAFLAAEALAGGSAAALANLAKLYESRGEGGRAKETRWRALERDANQELALSRFLQLAEEDGGETGFMEALRRVDALPGSWRAKVWLARHALQAGDKGRAVGFHREVLARPEARTAEALTEMSGDLGKAGELEALVRLFGPVFDPAAHGPQVGNNLIKANLELGRIAEARALLESLYAQNRPDWRPQLAFWQAELDKRSGMAAPPAGEPLQIAVMPLAGPIWARKQEGFDALLPAKAAGAPQICIAAPTVSAGTDSVRPAGGANGPGRREEEAGVFSRALAVYLAERIHLETTAVGTALLLGLKDQPGFVMGNAPYPPEQLLQMAKFAAAASPCPYVIDAHIDIGGPKWKIALTALDTATGKAAAAFSGETHPDDPGALLRDLAARLSAFVRERIGTAPVAPPAWYAEPGPGQWPALLVARLQTLVVATAALRKGEAGFAGAGGERSLLDGLVLTAAESDRDAVARLLLITALSRYRELGSRIYLEYADRVSQLARSPLPDEVGRRIAAAVESLFPAVAAS